MFSSIQKVLKDYNFDITSNDVMNIAYDIYDSLNELRVDRLLFSNKKNKDIIAFTGSIGSGKTTSQKLVSEMCDCEILNFSDELKKLCVKVFKKYPSKSFYGNQIEKEEKYSFYKVCINGRSLMQMVGTEIVRNTIDSDFWVSCMKKNIWHSKKSKIIIGDLRFDNEAQFISDHCGKIIFLKNPHNENDKNYKVHESEIGINSMFITHKIEENSVEKLRNCIFKILQNER